MWPNIDDKDDYQPTRERRGGQSDRQEPTPDPSFHRSSRSWLCLLMRLNEKHSLPALRAFGQVRQHPLVFPRGSCTLHEHTELVRVGVHSELEIPVQPCRSLFEIGSPADFCSNLRRLTSTSLGSVPSASSAARRLRPVSSASAVAVCADARLPALVCG